MTKAVARYNLSGDLVAMYGSVKEAAEQNRLSLDTLYHLLRKSKRVYKGYVWQVVDSPNTIPQNIASTPVKPVIDTDLRKKLGLTKLKYPCEDLCLLDLEGEVWKPLPDFEEYYMVSNLGRIKWLPRWIYFNDGRKRFSDEKIMKQYVSRHTIKDNKTGIPNLFFRIHIEKMKQMMIVSRTVYSTFVRKLKRFHDDRLSVLHHDLDPFNNRVENLYLATDDEVSARNIKVKWNPLAYNAIEIKDQLTKNKSKPVSQYTMDGKFIRSFSSIREAYRQTGIDQKSIILTAKGKIRHGGRYLWRYITDEHHPE
jgi:hypothetical protein